MYQQVNKLLEGYDIDAEYLYNSLKEYIKPNYKVAVIAFSFRDTNIQSAEDWDKYYGKENSFFYNGIVDSFKKYGITEEQISFVNYFSDTLEAAINKISNADILYFLGGLPDKMMERIKAFGIYDAVVQHGGIYMGYSAGAVIQLNEYHLSPDDDYNEFAYYEGFPFINNFYFEVHYEGTDIQNASIQHVLEEKKKPVYATELMSGAIIVDNGNIKTIGKVKKFEYN